MKYYLLQSPITKLYYVKGEGFVDKELASPLIAEEVIDVQLIYSGAITILPRTTECTKHISES